MMMTKTKEQATVVAVGMLVADLLDQEKKQIQKARHLY
jgi:hypothetical protein